MIEKVNPKHPDKLADQIAGAIVDRAYKLEANPKIAVEVLLGHKKCFTIIETTVSDLTKDDVKQIINRIVGNIEIHTTIVKQDEHLSKNQEDKIRCGDNGIFKGSPVTKEQNELSKIARDIFCLYNSDGKYILDNDRLIICQSNASAQDLKKMYPKAVINPLGFWTGGIDVDSGATNRKLGSDMGDGITGGGLHGKDLSKADVSVNIYAHLKAQELGKNVYFSCAIGDDKIDGKEYAEIVEIAKNYIDSVGGFEEFAKWGLF